MNTVTPDFSAAPNQPPLVRLIHIVTLVAGVALLATGGWLLYVCIHFCHAAIMHPNTLPIVGSLLPLIHHLHQQEMLIQGNWAGKPYSMNVSNLAYLIALAFVGMLFISVIISVIKTVFETGYSLAKGSLIQS